MTSPSLRTGSTFCRYLSKWVELERGEDVEGEGDLLGDYDLRKRDQLPTAVQGRKDGRKRHPPRAAHLQHHDARSVSDSYGCSCAGVVTPEPNRACWRCFLTTRTPFSEASVFICD